MRINLSWEVGPNEVGGFEIERKGGGGSEFSLLATLGSDLVAFADEAVVETSLYVYRVRAFRDLVYSDYSNEAMVQTPSAAVPLASVNTRADDVTAESAVIRWENRSTNALGYRVDRLGEPAMTLVSLPPGSTEFTMTALNPDEVYRIVIVAFNDAGDAPDSNEIVVRTGTATENLLLDASHTGIVELSWTDRTGGSAAFVIERKKDEDSFQTIGTVLSGVTRFLDEELVPGSRLVYRVLSRDEYSVTPDPEAVDVPLLPPTPASLSAALSPVNGSRIVLSWSPEPDGASGYDVERRTETTSFVSIRQLTDSTAVFYEDDSGTPFTKYVYRIRSFNLAGYSNYTGIVEAAPRAVFFLTGTLTALHTVGRGSTVRLPFTPRRVGSQCDSPVTNLWLIRVSETAVSAVVAYCTHQCLTVPSFQHDEANQRFRCVHGSQFDWFGRLLHGPAPQSVPTVPAELFADRVELSDPATSIPSVKL